MKYLFLLLLFSATLANGQKPIDSPAGVGKATLGKGGGTQKRAVFTGQVLQYSPGGALKIRTEQGEVREFHPSKETKFVGKARELQATTKLLPDSVISVTVDSSPEGERVISIDSDKANVGGPDYVPKPKPAPTPVKGPEKK